MSRWEAGLVVAGLKFQLEPKVQHFRRSIRDAKCPSHQNGPFIDGERGLNSFNFEVDSFGVVDFDQFHSSGTIRSDRQRDDEIGAGGVGVDVPPRFHCQLNGHPAVTSSNQTACVEISFCLHMRNSWKCRVRDQMGDDFRSWSSGGDWSVASFRRCRRS